MKSMRPNTIATAQSGVYPPSFCGWRLMLAVAAVTQVSVLLASVVSFQDINMTWLGLITVYAQALALMTAMSLCVTRAWLMKLSARGAWLGSWVIAVVVAWAFSYSAGIVGTVMGVGPGHENFDLCSCTGFHTPFSLPVYTCPVACPVAGTV
jgi:hypothetical protein